MHETLNLLHIDESDIVKTINVYSANSLKTTLYIKLIAVNQYRLIHIDVKNTIVFITMCMKMYYDKTHQSHFFNIDDIINLQLHHKYTLFSFIDQNKKLKQQFIDSLYIIKQIDRLVYHLDIFAS